ncbi:unnamed protein product [Adineta ricciae]|uniref:Uncharacterized protein n=1 Tax=Adineta ricciae TaxID=249248 RepID=A0A815VLS7_ADIRI|nr:unnamed protein product [Adineta ricciae]
MSTLHLFLIACILVRNSSCTNDLSFQVQPQPVRINNEEDIYVIYEDNYIGQVLYRSDQIQLECQCQTSSNQIEHHMYWTVNNELSSQYNNSNRIRLVINADNLRGPIIYVTCHCIFYLQTFHEITRNYRYKLYIDLESEPSLEAIKYSVEKNLIKERFNEFLRHHVFAIIGLALVIIGITCPLLLFNRNILT